MEGPFALIRDTGILPVIGISELSHAEPLAQALTTGGVPALEITLRSPAAPDAIRAIRQAFPGMALGAGTVLRPEQVDQALEAGASFIVTPGLSEPVIRHCLERDIPVVPGCTTGSEMVRALELGLDTVKYFPAEASGGLTALTLMHGPFPSLSFIPTGGMTMENIGEYLAWDFIDACGGSYMARAEDIRAGRWKVIAERCAHAMDISLGFALAHVGLNHGDAAQAAGAAKRFCALFRLPYREGNSSIFSGTDVEHMKAPYLGERGHIGFSTRSVGRALAWFRRQGIPIREDSIRRDAQGKLVSFYLTEEIAGFAVHTVQLS